MEIIVNGDKHDLPDALTVADLLSRFQVAPVRVAVERNREIVPKKLYATTALAPGDRIEIVTFVGGG